MKVADLLSPIRQTKMFWVECKNNGSICYCSDTFRKSLMFDYFSCLFQTWKTSKPTEEVLFQSEKGKEWFCYAALHHILEVKSNVVVLI